MRPLSWLFLASAVLAWSAPALAQGALAMRVAQSADGVVRLQFESRAGVCGDGSDIVGYRNTIFGRNFQSTGKWSNVRCVAGPLRVSLTKDHGQVSRVRTQVGGNWPAVAGRTTDLGTVDSREASSYFFTLVPALESGTGRDRLLIPAVLAAEAPVIAPLLALARDRTRAEQTRRAALQWLGQLGDASIVPALTSFVRDGPYGTGDETSRRKGIVSSALAALAMLEDNAGLPALIGFANRGPLDVRKDAVFWLGQNGDPRAASSLHTIIEDAREDSKLRSHAIFSLSNGDGDTNGEFAWLRKIYPRLEDDALREAVMQGMARDDASGSQWLIARARDANERLKVRRSALFWAGQSENTRTADIVSVYRDGGEAAFREHAIFVLSQRQDESATDALMRIAREDADTRMRGKALFWLAQKKDPRVTKLIADLVLK